MSVQKLSETKRPTAARVAAVQKQATAKLVSAAKERATFIAKMDETANKLSATFSSSRQFTKAELTKVVANLKVMAKSVESEFSKAIKHLNTALRADVATDKITAQAEDLTALKGKLAVLATVAAATVAGDDQSDDLLQIDDSGYVVDGADDVIDQLPDAPEADPVKQADTDGVTTDLNDPVVSSRKKADGQSTSEGDLTGDPVGRPDESTPKTQTDPSNPGSRGAPTPTSQSTSEGGLEGEPVGVPTERNNESGTQDSDGYSKEEPGSTPPSSSLAKSKKADGDVPDFMKDQPADSAAVKAQKAQARSAFKKSKAEGNDGDANYSKTEPGTPDSTVKTSKNTKADDLDPTAPPAPAAVPAADPVLDDSAADDLTDPTEDLGGDDMDLDTLSDDDADTDGLGGDDDMDLELPDAGFDDLLQQDILSDGEFPADDQDDAAPAPAAPELTASARTARRLTATKTKGAAPASSGESDVLKSVISDIFR